MWGKPDHRELGLPFPIPPPHLAIQPPSTPSFDRPCRYLYNRVLRRGFSDFKSDGTKNTAG